MVRNFTNMFVTNLFGANMFGANMFVTVEA